MNEPELPSGTHRVCPRCGTAAAESVWCESCGLNLKQQDELPTADAYAAKKREERWLHQQTERAQGENAGRQHAAGQAPKQTAKVAKISLVVAAALLLLGGGAAAALLLFENDDEQPATSAATETAGSQAEGREQATTHRQVGSAPQATRCRDVLDIGPTGSDPADAVSITARGVSCGDVRDVVVDFFRNSIQAGTERGNAFSVQDFACRDRTGGGFCKRRDGATIKFSLGQAEVAFENCGALPGSLANNFFNIEARGIECSEALEIVERQANGREARGFSCRSEQSGSESSVHVCTKGPMTVRYESGA